MGQEIERKFLINQERWATTEKPVGQAIRQGYLFNQGNKSCRVRIADEKAFLNIKHRIDDLHRGEFEYEIPLADGLELLDTLCENSIEKTRYNFLLGKHTWEVDIFEGANEGLIVAEIELESADKAFEKPDWVTEEVTADDRYLNTNLAERPFRKWRSVKDPKLLL